MKAWVQAGLWLIAVLLVGAGTAHAELLAGWRKTNAVTGAVTPYVATTNHLKMTAQMTWTNFYKYNDNSWFYLEPFHTGVLVNGVSATNYWPYTRPFTQYIEFCFTVDPGYKIIFTNMLLRGQNDERRLWFHLRSETDNFSQDLIIGNNDHSTGQWTNRNYLTTTNSFRNYTNALYFLDVTNRPVRLRLYGVAARSQWAYFYMTNLTTSAYAYNCMIAFEGEVKRAIDVIPSSGPLVGGNIIVLTNAVDPIIGDGTDITNVQVGALSITNFLGQGTNWVSWVAPPGDSPGAKDIIVCSASTGNTIITRGYTYNPTGVILGASPASGDAAGGYSVAIVGSNLCDGTDITNLIFGGHSLVPSSQSATQVVVTVPAGSGTVDVQICSTSFGESFGSSVFIYTNAGPQDQTITFDPIAVQRQSASVGLVATASSGLEVSFAVESGPGSITGGTNLTFLGVGEVAVVASQGGDGSWNPAPDVTNLVKVFAVSTSIGPYGGGNTITITNGHFGTITNVLVGGLAAVIQGSGSDWVTIIVPETGSSGAKDIVIQTDGGDITLANAYTVNEQGTIYDNDVAGKWEEIVGVPISLYGHAVGVLSNGLYTVGGSGAITNVYWFDGTNWSKAAGLPSGREYMTADALNGSLYAIGGRAVGTFTNVYQFDGSAWTEVAGLPAARYSMACGVVSGALYAAGGFGSAVHLNVYRFDGTNWSEVAGLPQARCELSAAVLNGELYVAGGYGGDFSARTNVFRFNGTTWSDTVGLPVALYGAGMCEWEGALYHVGGRTAGGVLSSNVYRFDGTNWTQIAGLPAARNRLGVRAMGGHIYAIGGDSGGSQTNVYRYPSAGMNGVSPASGSWTGGYPVVITGTNLGSGVDITNVTLCGVSVASIQSQSATQVVVTAGVGSPGLGDVRVYSVSYGETVKSNAFTYTASDILVTVPPVEPVPLGSVVTNIFSVTNSGTEALLITAATNNGAGAAYFDVSAIPGVVEPGTVSNFPVVFTAGEIGHFTPTCYTVNNSPYPNYYFGLAGVVFHLSTNAGPYAGGNTITITNGHFGTITNVLVGGVAAVIQDSGSDWVTIVLPAVSPAGVKDIVVQTDTGDITLPNAYTYNPAGWIADSELVRGGPYIAAGRAHSLGVKSDGTMVAWGWNDDGQTDVPSPNTNFVAVSAGRVHSLGLKSDGTITAWGNNGDGQTNVPSPNVDFVAVAAGYYHSLGLKSDGSVVAWGANWSGQTNVPSPNTNFVAVAGGFYHSLGLKSDGTIVAWGANDYGQTDVPLPNADFVSVAAGWYHSLGLKSDGMIVAWGSNGVGQLDVPLPNTNFVAVAALADHSLGLKSDGTIVAWGANDYGQTDVPLPNTDFVAVAAGSYHSLGLKSDGTIVAWGWNDDGQTNVPAPNADFGKFAYGVLPASGSWTGGYPVVITGTNLGSGADITNVTLAGVAVDSIVSQSATQVVVTAGVGSPGLGDVVVQSVSYGTTTKSNAFTYLMPQFILLGTNGAVIANSNTTSLANGTDMGEIIVGQGTLTNVFSMTNSGNTALIISGIATNSSTAFSILNAPSVVPASSVVQFSMVFDPQGGQQNASFSFVHNGTNSPFILNVRGTGIGGGIALGTNLLVFSGVFLGSDPVAQWVNMRNVGVSGFSYSNTWAYGAGASGWLGVSPVAGSVAFGGEVVLTNAVSLAGVNAGIYYATNRVSSADATNAPQSYMVALVVDKASQTITWPPMGGQITTSRVGLAASATSGLPVDFSVLSGPANIAGGTNLTFSGAGEVLLMATQTGNSNWYGAPSITNTFTVTKAVAGVTLNNLSQTYNGTSRVVTATTVPGALTVVMTYDGSGTAPINAGSYSITGVVSDVMYQGLQTGVLMVAKANQGGIIFTPASPQTYLTTNLLSASGGSGTGLFSFEVVSGPGELVSTNALRVTSGTGTVLVRATKAGDDNWNPASVTGAVTAAKASQVVTFPNPGNQIATNIVTLTASASSLLPVTYEVFLGPAVIQHTNQVAFTNKGAVILVALQAGDANWNPAGSNVAFTVVGASAAVHLTNLSHVYDGGPKSAAATTLPPGLNVVVTYAGDTNWPVNAGDYTLVGIVQEPLYQGGATDVFTIARAPQTITFGVIGDQVITNAIGLAATASSGLPVSFGVTGPAALAGGTNLSFTGTGVVSVTASQAGNTNWLVASNVVHVFTVYPLRPALSGVFHANAEATTADMGAVIENVYGANATERGILWSTNEGFAAGSAWKASQSGLYGAGGWTQQVAGLVSGLTNYYRAYAVNAAGTSYTVQAWVHMKPEAPVADPGSNINPDSFQANWNAARGATNYLLDASEDDEFGSFLPGYENRGVGDVLSHTVTGLTAGMLYHYRVRAENEAGVSTNSETISVLTAPRLTILTWPRAAGQTIPEQGSYIVDFATPTQVVTWANPGYQFAYWEGAGAILVDDYYARTTTVTLLMNSVLTAYYQQQASGITWTYTHWHTNYMQGAVVGEAEVCNMHTNGTRLMGPFWYCVQSNNQQRLRFPTGVDSVSGWPYVNVTDQIEAGAGDGILDPGECVTVTNIAFYSYTLKPISNIVWQVRAIEIPAENRVDTDGDGIPDEYEGEYPSALDPLNPTDGPLDFDEDGVPNDDESVSGTDPTDEHSFLALDEIARPFGVGNLLSWPSVTGRVYGLYWTSNALHGYEMILEGIPATPPANTVTDAVFGVDAQGFYHIDVRNP